MNRSSHFGKVVSHLLQSRVPAPPPQQPQQQSWRPHLHLIVAGLIKYRKGTTIACFRRARVAKHISKFPVGVAQIMAWSNIEVSSTRTSERERKRERERERESESERVRE